VIATWKRTIKGARVVVEVEPLRAITATRRKQVVTAFTPYAQFLEKELDVRFVD